MVAEAGRRVGHAVPGEVVRAGAQEGPDLAEPDRADRGIAEGRQPYGEIDSLLDEVDHAVQEQHARPHAVMLGQERLQHRHQLQAPEQFRRGERDRPFQPSGPGARLRLSKLGEHPAIDGGLALAERRRLHPTRRPVQEPFAETGLQDGDRARDGGGRAPELARRGGERSFVDRGDEQGHGVEPIHRCRF